jgi:malate dehydrogenase (oxaloacetate-decarboxylating)
MRGYEMTSLRHNVAIRTVINNDSENLGRMTSTISKAGAQIGAIDLIRVDGEQVIRDISINACDDAHVKKITKKLNAIDGVDVRFISDRTFLMHLGGKIEVASKHPIAHRDDLSMAYTPGVAKVCTHIHENPMTSFNLTIRKNTVAVVTDGSAVLGLGNIGPEAAMPVMEGKAMLFKEFGGVDAFPICLATQDAEEIIAIVKALTPTFGGINLEDIAAPKCFEIERRLKKELDIPVFHDDQHGTAAVVIAAMINSLKLVDKQAENIKVVISGVGAAGTACKDMLLAMGVKNIVGIDRQGIISRGREGLNSEKEKFAESTNPNNESGSLTDAMVGADVFIGVSAPKLLSVKHLKSMAKDPIVFAMANPTPEIMPEDAKDHVAIIATGRSDYPNQINNLLAFPGIFRGAMDAHARNITNDMLVAAAHAIAGVIDEDELSSEYIIPSVFNKRVMKAVSRAVKAAVKPEDKQNGRLD